MTVFLGISKRSAAAVLIIAANIVPSSLSASASGAGQQTQTAKPSPQVPAASLPVTQPTSAVEQTTKPKPLPPAQRLTVDFADGQITVDATNASLNEVLHEIGTKAKIKITGNVSDERVFGRYGPSTPATLLAGLLDGTSSNMLLVDDAEGASELILTRRPAGATPPNAIAAATQSISDDQDRPAQRYIPPPRPFQPAGPGRGQVGSVSAADAGASGGSNGPDTSQSDAESRTAQQIYEHLQNAENLQRLKDAEQQSLQQSQQQ